MSATFRVLAVVFIAVAVLFAQEKPVEDTDVTRATLDNGLRVVIVGDPLAPVVTVEQNYVAGGDETPDGFPGMAHAQEHMAFRGCSSLSADQISAIFAQLGGFGNADTQQNITQYFSTVPAADLDIALRVDADCMRDIQDAQKTRTIYTVTYACDPKNVSTDRDLILRDLVSMQKENVTPNELQHAKALLLRQIPLTESTEDSVAGGLLARAQMGLPLEEPLRAAKLYFSMTADQVRAAFNKWVRPDGFVQIIRGPLPQ